MVAAHGIEVSAVRAENLKLNTGTINRRRAPSGRDIISDAALFNLFGVDRIKALDRSDYEGAEIIDDLGTPVPDELKCCADFIVDGSTLDNTFNPALTLKNYCELLRPGGRLCLINTLSNHFDPYTIATPSWFFDYFVMNKFDDCRVYIIVISRTRSQTHFPSMPIVCWTREKLCGTSSPHSRCRPLSSPKRGPVRQPASRRPKRYTVPRRSGMHIGTICVGSNPIRALTSCGRVAR